MMEIKDSVAVITGGSRGIGFGLAKYWAEKGGKVVLASSSEKNLLPAEAEIKSMGGEVSTIVCDVTKEEDCSRMADFVIERYGQINLVAPFAGIIRDGLMIAPDKETGKVAKKMSLEQFQCVINTNLTGVFLTVRVRGADGQSQLQGTHLPGFLNGLHGNSRPDQLLVHQGRHVRYAQSPYGRIFQARACRQDPLRGGRPGLCRNPHG